MSFPLSIKVDFFDSKIARAKIVLPILMQIRSVPAPKRFEVACQVLNYLITIKNKWAIQKSHNLETWRDGMQKWKRAFPTFTYSLLTLHIISLSWESWNLGIPKKWCIVDARKIWEVENEEKEATLDKFLLFNVISRFPSH